VRINYTISFDPDHDRATGTETLTAFPLQGIPWMAEEQSWPRLLLPVNW
jgi:hypothetical protein